MIYIAGSAVVVGSESICFNSLLYWVSIAFNNFHVGMTKAIHMLEEVIRRLLGRYHFHGEVRLPLDCTLFV